MPPHQLDGGEIAAPATCKLDKDGLRSQAERYARLAATVANVERAEDAVTVDFGAGLDHQMLEDALAVERDCCPFFDLDFDPASRRLRVGVSDPAQRPALDAIAAALTPPRNR